MLAVPSAVNVTLTEPGPAFATVGVAILVPGVSEAADSGDVILVSPLPLGVTLNLYAVPELSPVIVQFCETAEIADELVTVQLGPAVVKEVPLKEFTVYVVAVPSAVNVTVAEVALAAVAVGAARAAASVMADDFAETVDPLASAAPLVVGVTLNSYEEPAVRPVTVQL